MGELSKIDKTACKKKAAWAAKDMKNHKVQMGKIAKWLSDYRTALDQFETVNELTPIRDRAKADSDNMQRELNAMVKKVKDTKTRCDREVAQLTQDLNQKRKELRDEKSKWQSETLRDQKALFAKNLEVQKGYEKKIYDLNVRLGFKTKSQLEEDTVIKREEIIDLNAAIRTTKVKHEQFVATAGRTETLRKMIIQLEKYYRNKMEVFKRHEVEFNGRLKDAKEENVLFKESLRMFQEKVNHVKGLLDLMHIRNQYFECQTVALEATQLDEVEYNNE